MDSLYSLLLLIPLAGAVFGLVWWAKRAETDRSANVGLYLLFGIPGGLLSVAGAALLVNGVTGGWLALGLGLGMALPLVRGFRRLVAMISPMDATSPVHMSGLAVLLALGVYFSYTLIAAPLQPDEVAPATIGDLVVNVITFALLGYLAVGWLVHRTGRDATDRLGLTIPNWQDIVIGVAAVAPVFMLSIVGSLLTLGLQPDVFDGLTETTQEMTSGIQSPLGALAIGISAGVGEELLFRGAIQPRFGIVLTSALWALVHTQYQFTFVVLGLFGIGILFGLIRKYVGTTSVIIAHAVYNAAVVMIQLYA